MMMLLRDLCGGRVLGKDIGPFGLFFKLAIWQLMSSVDDNVT